MNNEDYFMYYNESKAIIDLKPCKLLPENSFEYPLDNIKDFKFKLFDVKTSSPPTDITISIDFLRSEAINFDLFEYRKMFQFENGYYTLYLEEIEVFKTNGIPATITIENKRDKNFEAKIFYSFKIKAQKKY